MKVVPAVMLSYGGSNRKIKFHLKSLQMANIPYHDLGPAKLNSKRRLAVIPADRLADARAVGLRRSRVQWSWIEEKGYFFDGI